MHGRILCPRSDPKITSPLSRLEVLLLEKRPAIFSPVHRFNHHKNLMSSSDGDSWGVLAPVYAHVERLTIPPCQSLINRVSGLLPLSNPNTHAFDNGCGTGIVTATLKEEYPQVPVLATDISDGMISLLRTRISDRKWTDVSARIVDSRDLSGILDNSFTHTFSAFMVCLAPDPDQIVREMLRVTKPDGVLGLAVWGDARFGQFFAPWEVACRELLPDHKPPAVMGEDWTLDTNVRAGLEKAGFKDVEVRKEDQTWKWENAEDLGRYLFEGGNPLNMKVIESFKVAGGDVEKAKAIYVRVAREKFSARDGSVEIQIPATLATARK